MQSAVSELKTLKTEIFLKVETLNQRESFVLNEYIKPSVTWGGKEEK